MTYIVNDFAEKVAATKLESWQAWRMGERESDPLAIGSTTSLEEAVNAALLAIFWQSGDCLAVLHSHTGLRKFTLWQFTVRRSSKNGVWRDSTNGGRKVFVGRLEPKLVSKTVLAAPFAPVERFDAFRDNPVGVDLQLVEGNGNG